MRQQVGQRMQYKGTQMCARMRQNRIGRRTHQIAHRDNIEVERAGRVGHAAAAASLLFDPLQDSQ